MNAQATDEELRKVLADNYASAEENAADVRKQVQGEVNFRFPPLDGAGAIQGKFDGGCGGVQE